MFPLELGQSWPLALQAPHLAAALLGYAAIALVPGPNMLVVASVAALRGQRAALPHCLGTASGIAVLAACSTLLASSMHPGSAADLLLRAGSALLLLRAAWRIARLPQPGRPEGVAARRSRFLAGFQVAALNPLAVGHFTGVAGLVASPDADCAAWAIPLLALGAGAIALAVGTAVAVTFGCDGMQRAIRDIHRPVCLGAACLLSVTAIQRLFTLTTGG